MCGMNEVQSTVWYAAEGRELRVGMLLELIPLPCPILPRLPNGTSTPNFTSRYSSTTSHSILSTSGSLIYFPTFRIFLHTQMYTLCCTQEEHPLPHWPPHHQRNLKKSVPPSKLLPRQ